MSSATPISMSLSIATDTCHLSLPSIFTSKPHYLYLSLSFPRRPPSVNLRLVHSLSLKPPKTISFFVAKTSNWAQQEEDTDTTFTVAADSEQQQWGSENESEGRDSNLVSQEEAVAAGGEEFDGEEPQEYAKIYVGNLPYDVDSQKLAMLFEQAGIVEIAEVVYNRETGRSRGFGFVSMRTVEEAEKAVHMFHRYDLDGRLLVVNKAAPRGSRLERTPPVYEQAYRIFVGNLPWGVDDARLEQIFSEHGKVVDAWVASDRETGRSRGFGFVTMSAETEQNDAIAALDGRSLDGRTIRVNVAEQRQRRNL